MAKRRPKEEKKQKRIRVNMRLPYELADWTKEDAEARNTTLTQVVVDTLTDLKAENTV